ncbi:hypothetical protein WJX72_005920 [[Myrmecia] bisecta]|uniref:U-box domain-containing protein n=1 Tax=[Myrmecia] bisecta TaxID=41462 RepID=A0AAW1QQW6_9CHLO
MASLLPQVLQYAYHVAVAASQVRSNKKDCAALGKHLLDVKKVLEQEHWSSPPSQAALRGLQRALEDAEKLVKRCQEWSLPMALVLSHVTASEFQDVARCLTSSLQLLVAASLPEQRRQLQELSGTLLEHQFEAERATARLHGMIEAGVEQTNHGLYQMGAELKQQITAALQDTLAGVRGDDSQSTELKKQLEVEAQLAAKNTEKLEEYYLTTIVALLSEMEAGSSSTSATPVRSKAADPPPELFCPIGRELMSDPVLLVETGHTYERANIETWFAGGHRTCPVTGSVISSMLLAPNWTLKQMLGRQTRVQESSSFVRQAVKRYPPFAEFVLKSRLPINKESKDSAIEKAVAELSQITAEIEASLSRMRSNPT